MKVVFLDFDGVLTTLDTKYRYGYKPCVKALNYIIEQTQADIVVSSTWRFEGVDACANNLSKWGVVGNVIGRTPCFPFNDTRGKEIKAWLTANPTEKFVILDDDDDMEDLYPYLVKTNTVLGLIMPDAQKAVTILNS
jgi:hypothetical protein